MNALAHAIAHSPANATHATSDIAKTREGTTPHHTTRHLVVAKSQDQGGLSQGGRFWSKVSDTSDAARCWTWNASKSKSGYGQFWDGATMVRAHRWAYQELVGPIDPDLECDHLCRNKACVNPNHIELVTHAVNVERRIYRHDAERRRKMSDLAKARWAAKREADRVERDSTGWWVCI